MITVRADNAVLVSGGCPHTCGSLCVLVRGSWDQVVLNREKSVGDGPQPAACTWAAHTCTGEITQVFIHFQDLINTELSLTYWLSEM